MKSSHVRIRVLLSIPVFSVWFGGWTIRFFSGKGLRHPESGPPPPPPLYLLLYTKTFKRKRHMVTCSLASHRHDDVISWFIPAAAIGLTSIRSAKCNRAKWKFLVRGPTSTASRMSARCVSAAWVTLSTALHTWKDLTQSTALHTWKAASQSAELYTHEKT